MNKTYTPGPWWLTDSGVRDRGGYICHTNKATHYPGQDERYESETAERAANACLIAAAPELLEACKQAEAWLSGWASAEPYLSIIRAAIAKATPESIEPTKAVREQKHE